jgi:CBS domain containing-hemolysin-like protein
MTALLPVAAGALGWAPEPGPLALALLVVLFGASFFFSGTETALFSLQQVDRERLQRDGTTGRMLHSLLEHRAPLITTILMGNESANIALTAVVAALVDATLPDAPWVAVLVVTPTLVLVSEITPKVLAFRFRVAWARLATWPLATFAMLVSPVRLVFSALVSALARAAGVPKGAAEERLAEDELMVYVDRSTASGELDPVERDIIEAVFELDDMPISRLMTPRPDVFSLPLNIGWTELLEGAHAAGHSRVPVRGRSEDDIVGVLIVKDLLRYRKAPLEGPRQLRSILMPPIFVPATMPAHIMLQEFLAQRFHMAFVVDEHGTLTGLITMDDLLSELLRDEEASQESEIALVRPDVLTVKATMDVEDFVEETGIPLPAGSYHTVGGFVFHELGRLPKEGDTIRHEGRRFVVEEVDGRRISEIRVVADPQESAP